MPDPSGLVFAIGMWIHAILNAIVCFEPHKPPYEWVGEVRLIPVVAMTVVVWCFAWVILY